MLISFKALLLSAVLEVVTGNANILNYVKAYFGIPNAGNDFVVAHQKAVCGGVNASGQSTTGFHAEFVSDISQTNLTEAQKDYARVYYIHYIKLFLTNAQARQSTATAYSNQNPSDIVTLTGTASDIVFVHKLAFFVAIDHAENIN